MDKKVYDEYHAAISVLKFFMAFEVVLCHFWTINIKTDGILGMFHFLQNIAAPTFMIISFYVCEKKIAVCDSSYLKRRVLQLYSPNAFWAVIYFAVLWLGQYFSNTFSCHITDLLWQLLFGCSKPLNGQMWFSINLIILTCFFAIIYKISKGKFAYIMYLCIAFAFVQQYSNINYKLWGGVEYEIRFPLGRVIEMVPYAATGVILSRYDIFAKIKRYRYFVLGISVLLLYMFKKHIDLPVPNGFQYQGLDLFFISILVFTSFMLFPWEHITDRCKRILLSMSKNTNGIYYIHMLTGIILQFIIRKCGLPYQTFYSCIIVYAISYLVICIIRRIPLNFIKWVS